MHVRTSAIAGQRSMSRLPAEQSHPTTSGEGSVSHCPGPQRPASPGPASPGPASPAPASVSTDASLDPASPAPASSTPPSMPESGNPPSPGGSSTLLGKVGPSYFSVTPPWSALTDIVQQRYEPGGSATAPT